MQLRSYDHDTDRPWLEERMSDGYGAGHLQARRGELIDVLAGQGLIAERDGEPLGVILWAPTPDGSTELRYIWAFGEEPGTGRAMVTAMVECVDLPVWAVTTNDNVDALRLYQRLGFRLRELRAGAVDEARRTLKPSIPTENGGIPIRDELELVLDEPRTA